MSDIPSASAVAVTAADASGDDVSQPSGVSMMITRRQRAALVALGYTEAAIRTMSPAEAHALLGLGP